MKIMLIASECAPFIKTGGLADVAGALPLALKKQGAEVSVLLPKYSMIGEQYRKSMKHLAHFYVHLGWRTQYVGVELIEENGVKWYFIDNEYYFKQEYVYSSGDFETERFCYFCRAALEMMLMLDLVPDVIHLNDWQTGLIALLLSEQYRICPEFERVKTVFTIHNLRYQGLMNPQFTNELLSIGERALSNVEYYSNVNALKAGIVYADAVTTVSPTYAREITTPMYGETLDGLLSSRKDGILGILNGIDRRSYNPWTDKALECRFSKNSLSGKAKCKAALQKELGLCEDENAPLAAVISRLTNQKGIDLILAALPALMEAGVQLAVLGMGERALEERFGMLASSDLGKGRIAFRCEMNDALARRFYAGADMFLMPSAFEPCGLSQMLALRYGCVPIVRETGGLADSVQNCDAAADTGNGFVFRGYTAGEFLEACTAAVELYRENRAAWKRLVERGMAADLGWDESAKKYMELYKQLAEAR